MRSPVLSREMFYGKLPDGSFYLLDWNLINTELGAMVEPRQIVGFDDGQIAPEIANTELSFNKISQIDENTFYDLMGSGGQQASTVFDRE